MGLCCYICGDEKIASITVNATYETEGQIDPDYEITAICNDCIKSIKECKQQVQKVTTK